LNGGEVQLAGLAKSRVLEDEERFAARQGFSLAAAWAEKAGPEEAAQQWTFDERGQAEGLVGQLTKEPAPAEEPPARVGELPPGQELVGQATKDEAAEQAARRPGRSRGKGRYAKETLERSPERVFLPGQKNPLVLRQNTSEMFLLQRLRDEAHRFAITFHRKLRRERSFRSVLEEIPGVGEKRKRALLSHFGSLKRIRAASAAEIAEVPGMSGELAESVRSFLAGEAGARAEVAESAEAASAEAEAAALGPGDGPPARALERDDVAFDAAAAELAALDEEVDEEEA
jgi:hypothetical protein